MFTENRIDSLNELSYGRGYVYLLRYHVVWCTKYRREVITGSVYTDMFEYLQKSAEQIGVTLEEVELKPDHVHLMIKTDPQVYIPNMIKILKGNTARWSFMSHPEIKAELWGGHLWNPSYFIATVSDRNTEQIREYIRNQKKK